MRTYAEKVIEMIDDGVIPARMMAIMCVLYMSEHDIEDMLKANDINFEDDK